MIEKVIRKWIVAKGTGAGDRVFPVVAPQDVEQFPIVVLERISTDRPHSHTRRSSGLAVARIQIRTWAKTYTEAKTVDEEIRMTIDGRVGKETIDARDFDVQAILATDDRDDYDEELRCYGTLFDVLVWYDEEIPETL